MSVVTAFSGAQKGGLLAVLQGYRPRAYVHEGQPEVPTFERGLWGVDSHGTRFGQQRTERNGTIQRECFKPEAASIYSVVLSRPLF